jgi:hypothetical protein
VAIRFLFQTEHYRHTPRGVFFRHTQKKGFAMKFRMLRQAAVGIAGLGLLIPPTSLSAADPQRPVPATPGAEALQITDVALAPGGTLVGQVVDSAGVGVAGAAVTVRHNETVVASTVSTAQGNFAIRGLQGGVFQVSAGQGLGIYRLWAPETAPPAAGKSALIVSDATTVRGQTSRIGQFLTNPLVVAGIVAVAVAVPVTVHEYRKDHKSGS